MLRLSASAYTAARACHNFYEVVEYFTSADTVSYTHLTLPTKLEV